MILFLPLMIAGLGRDLGPMQATESAVRAGQPEEEDAESKEEAERARQQARPKPGIPALARNGFLPLGTVMLCLILGLFYTNATFGYPDAVKALIWASMMGLLVPMAALKYQGLMTPSEILHAWITGMQVLIEPIFVLLGAWALGDVVKELQLPAFVVQVLGSSISPGLLPTLVFASACVVAFSTGTSFGTMAVMFPLVIPLMWNASSSLGTVAAREASVVQGIGAILAGAIFGDHCSPISDTTVLSAVACGCKATEHVRTQAPYAGLAAGVAIVFGYLPTGLLGFPVGLSILLGWASLAGLVWVLGTPVAHYQPGEEAISLTSAEVHPSSEVAATAIATSS